MYQSPTNQSAEKGAPIVIGALCVDLPHRNALVTPDAEIEVLPPIVNGQFSDRTGAVYLVPDVDALLSRLNTADPQVRMDIEHSSEPSSPTFHGSTSAIAWLKDFKRNDRGGINGTITRHTAGGEYLLSSNIYRYVSPAFYHDQSRRILNLTSVALTNAPKLPIQSINSHTQQVTNMPTDTDLDKREQALNAQSEALDKREQALNAQLEALDKQAKEGALARLETAAKQGAINDAQRQVYASMIDTHKDGIQAGAQAVDSVLASLAPVADPDPLTMTGAPAANRAALTSRIAGHTAGGTQADGGRVGPVLHSQATGRAIDPASAELDGLIQARMAQTREPYDVALAAICAGQPTPINPVIHAGGVQQ